MILVVSTLLALLEASRFQDMRRLTKLQTELALESAFARYNVDLWEEYRILACNQNGLEKDIEQSGNRNAIRQKEGINFFQFVVSDIKMEDITRLTDGDGQIFFQEAVSYMERNLEYEIAKELYSRYEGIKNLQETSEFDILNIKKALEELEKPSSSENSVGNKKETILKEHADEQIIQDKENLLEKMQALQEKGVLSLVIENANSLSDKKIDLSKTVSHRGISNGKEMNATKSDWYTRILFQQYILTYLSNYTQKENHAMDYEVEYLIVGEATEVANMKEVVTELLGIREVANFTYLMSNPVKVEQAGGLAVSIVGSTLNPMLVGMVRLAILAAWAFAESILDIRTLLSGGKIALLKSDENWTLGVENISSVDEGYKMAKNCSNGLSYKEYLGILLLFEEETVLANRTMDMQELTLQTIFKRENFYFEECIVAETVEVSYRYAPVFFSIQSMLPNYHYEIRVKERFSYN